MNKEIIMKELNTTHTMAEKFGVRLHKVTYAIKALHLEADAVAGRVGVYYDEKFNKIKSELERMSANKRNNLKGDK